MPLARISRAYVKSKWTVGFERWHRDNSHESAISYLSVTSESRVDEPVKIDTPFTATGKGPDRKVRLGRESWAETHGLWSPAMISSLNVTLKAPDGRVYGLGGDRAVYRPLEMKAFIKQMDSWRRHRDNSQEAVIAYSSVTSESRLDEPVKVRVWIDAPFTATAKGPDHMVTTTAVITAEVTKRYNYVICADVLALVDRPTGDPVV
ncbi:unnamed protein product, partial [Medioppia subpectinata]